ncbi:MAG: hypothetical protein EOO88_16330 [Pedobacter sp.]|nr:MAG: hypothetical protein EOO88_16330 [Pedobacter sp.]
MKNFFIILHFLVFACIVAKAKVYKVNNVAEFKEAAALVVAGDEIIIANGSYSNWEVTTKIDGKAGKPVVIRAETPGKVVFSGDVNKPVFHLRGSFTEISGLSFEGCHVFKGNGGVLIELRDTKHSRITNCIFTRNVAKSQYTPIVVVSGMGMYNRVDHCSFTGNVDNQELQVLIKAKAVPLYTTIENNVFIDKSAVMWKGQNGGECVQIGQDPILMGTLSSYTMVCNNRFIRCNGEGEVISNKSSGNSYINNYFEDCRGELVMRGGHDCLVDSNTFKGGSGGIRINGTHHTVTNNVLSGLSIAIRLMYGMAKGKTEIGFYVAASDCRIKNNYISNCNTGILIGDNKGLDWTGKFDAKKYPSRTMQDVAPFNNTLADNVIAETKKLIVYN